MVKLTDTKTNKELKRSGYYRLFETNSKKYNDNVSLFISRIPQMVQSSVIKNGDELEKFLSNSKYHNKNHNLIKSKKGKYIMNVDNIEKTLINRVNDKKEYWIFNPNISKSLFNKYDLNITKKHLEPDIIIIKGGKVYVVEIKDGGNFDTKKSEGEGKQLKIIKELIEKILSKTIVKAYFVVWNIQNLKNSSIKDKLTRSYAITGHNFAEKFSIKYDELKEDRLGNSRFNIKKMREYMVEAIKRMDKYSGEIDLNSDNKEDMLKDYKDVTKKEKEKLEKQQKKIVKERTFIIEWETRQIFEDSIKLLNTKRGIKKNSKKYSKLLKKYKKLKVKYN